MLLYQFAWFSANTILPHNCIGYIDEDDSFISNTSPPIHTLRKLISICISDLEVATFKGDYKHTILTKLHSLLNEYVSNTLSPIPTFRLGVLFAARKIGADRRRNEGARLTTFTFTLVFDLLLLENPEGVWHDTIDAATLPLVNQCMELKDIEVCPSITTVYKVRR